MMSQVKWNNDDIFQFLDVYEQYPILWNIKHKDYLNRNLKISNFEKLKNNLSSIGLVVDSDQLRLKIKSIRDVYRQEIAKINRSKKSGAGTDSLYKPKLIWFNRANTFLNEVTSTRESSSNLVSFIFIIHFTIHFSLIFIHLVYMVFNY